MEEAAAATESAEQPQSQGSDDDDGLEHAAEADAIGVSTASFGPWGNLPTTPLGLQIIA